MKRTFLIFTLILLLSVYIVFIYKQSEFVAGEYRYYTLYEKFKAKDKYIDNSINAYNNDLYNLKLFKEKLISEVAVLDKYKKNLSKYNDSINLNSNSLSDYDRYISNLKILKNKFQNQIKIVSSFEKDLMELEKYINRIERGLLSIKMYKSEIFYLNSAIKSIDSTKTKYFFSLSISQYIAAKKGLELVEKIKQEEVERQNFITQIDLQNQKMANNNKNFDYISEYLNNKRLERIEKTGLPNEYYSISNISNYPNPSYYSTNTNSNTIQIKGYYKANGTYVEPHIRTVRNNTEEDNFSFYGNLNPYTGKIGTKR